MHVRERGPLIHAQDAARKTVETMRDELEASWLRSCSAITKLRYTAARFAEIQPV